jgi:acyl-CoA synthetase (AMP-forming)/AMP-acid ligase II
VTCGTDTTVLIFKTAGWTRNRKLVAITNRNLIGVAFFIIISCLIAINVMLCFPNLGLIVQQYNIFP